jgi:hypothetical protein
LELPAIIKRKSMRSPFIALLFCALGLPVSAQFNNWTNTASGNWEDAVNWSLGLRPAANQTIAISNPGYKAVGISSSTAANFPASLTINNLSISAPTNTLNTLLLNYAGTGIPLRVLNSCSVGSNGTLLNLYSSLQVDGSNGGGFLVSDGGQFMEEGGFSHIAPLVQLQNGTLNATNAALTLGGLQVGSLSSSNSGTVNQSGGTLLASNIYIDRGEYNLMDNGTIYALNGTYLRSPGGHLSQWSGSNYGDIFLTDGYYYMNGGLAHGNFLSTAGHSEFYHSAGTVEYSLIEIRGADYPTLGALYTLQGANLRCGTLSIMEQGTFRQLYGTSFLTNGLRLFAGACYMGGGDLFMPSMVVSNTGYFSQSGGATHVAGDISIYETGFLLTGGTFSSMNFGVGSGVYFQQNGGTNEVKGVLSVSGQYDLAGGKASANGLYLRGTLYVFPDVPFVNSGTINLGGVLAFSSSQNSLGGVILGANSTLGAGGASVILHFANSSALNWDANSTLLMTGSSAFSGGGDHQIYFGNNASGLTPAQLAKIRFGINVYNMPLGYYPARILSTGEVVPVQQTPSIFVVGYASDYGVNFYPEGVTHDVVGLSVRHSQNIALRANGAVVAWAAYVSSNAPTATNFVGVAAGGDFFLALATNGTVTAWGGQNAFGQTSVPAGLNTAVAIAAGQSHAIALRRNNTILAWGANDQAQLNVPASASTAIAIAAGDYHNLALRSDNNVVAWGRNAEGQCTVPPSLSDVVGVAGGGYFSMALKNNGTVVCWGANESGQCNVPAGLSNVVAIAAGYKHALALRANGTLAAWGDSTYGATYIPPWATNIVQVAAGEGYAQVVPGGGTRLHARLTQPQLIPSWFDPGARWFTLVTPSRSGQILRLEYTDSIAPANWKPLPLAAGRADTTTLYDFNPTTPSRYYRVKQW